LIIKKSLLLFVLFFPGIAVAATVVCNSGQYYNNTACTGCTAGNYCPGITATVGGGVQGLNICTAGSYCMAWAAAPKTCASANATYINSDPGATSQAGCYLTCGAGQYVPWYGAPCTPCAAGSYSATVSFNVKLGDSTTCTACPKNYDDGATGTTSLSECTLVTTAGTYIATANATTATKCPAGYTCPSATVKYGQTSQPVICPADYYCPAWSNVPLSCAENNESTPNSDVGSDDATDCYAICPAGQHIPFYGSPCVPCESGTYGSPNPTRAVLNGSACNSCPTNYNDGATGLTDISGCAIQTTAGKYIATARATTETQCPANYYCASTLLLYGETNTPTKCKGAPAGSKGPEACQILLKTSSGSQISFSPYKNTTPSFNIQANGITYYGRMTTTKTGNVRIRLPNGTNYWLY
jgi:hypothetical protein